MKGKSKQNSVKSTRQLSVAELIDQGLKEEETAETEVPKQEEVKPVKKSVDLKGPGMFNHISKIGGTNQAVEISSQNVTINNSTQTLEKIKSMENEQLQNTSSEEIEQDNTLVSLSSEDSPNNTS